MDALCTEKWNVDNGIVSVEGDVAEADVVSISVRKNKEKSEEQEKKLDRSGAKSGNANKTKEESEKVRNPRSFEYLSKVEVRKFSKLARIAGMSLSDYIASIVKGSIEWNMLSTTVNC